MKREVPVECRFLSSQEHDIVAATGATGGISGVGISSGEMRLTPCDWKQFLEVQQQTKDQCDLLDGLLVSRASLAEGDNHTHLSSALRGLVHSL